MHLLYIYICTEKKNETNVRPGDQATRRSGVFNVYKTPRALQTDPSLNKKDDANNTELHCHSYPEKSSQILFDNSSSLCHKANSSHSVRHFLNRQSFSHMCHILYPTLLCQHILLPSEPTFFRCSPTPRR